MCRAIVCGQHPLLCHSSSAHWYGVVSEVRPPGFTLNLCERALVLNGVEICCGCIHLVCVCVRVYGDGVNVLYLFTKVYSLVRAGRPFRTVLLLNTLRRRCRKVAIWRVQKRAQFTYAIGAEAETEYSLYNLHSHFVVAFLRRRRAVRQRDRESTFAPWNQNSLFSLKIKTCPTRPFSRFTTFMWIWCCSYYNRDCQGHHSFNFLLKTDTHCQFDIQLIRH